MFLPDITEEQAKQLAKVFTYHPPKEGQPEIYEHLRAEGKKLAATIYQATPVCREQSLAITKVEEAIFWANAALARKDE